MFNDLKNSLAVTIRFELRKIHPILYSSINKNIFICTWTKCFDRNLQPNYMWNVFSHAFQYCNFGLLNMSALKLLHSTVLNISKDRFNYRASRAPFLFVSLEPEKLSCIRFVWCRHSFKHNWSTSDIWEQEFYFGAASEKKIQNQIFCPSASILTKSKRFFYILTGMILYLRICSR